LVKIFIRYV